MKLVPSRLRHLTREAAGSSFALLQGSQPVVSQRGAKAESVARERGRPVEPDPGNAGEGNISFRGALWILQSYALFV